MNEFDFNDFIKDVSNIVQDEIYEELKYQNNLSQSSGFSHKNKPSVAEEILMMQEYLDKARTEWTHNQGDTEALDVLRKVTAMGLRCLATHGCPRRR